MKIRFKKKNTMFILLGLILVVGIIGITNSLLNKKTDINDLININELSDEFMDKYFEELSAIQSDEEKENRLIVIAKEKIENDYGATKIIEAPNNQYILQFDSAEKKNAGMAKLETVDSVLSVSENEFYTIEEVTYNSWGISKMGLDYVINEADVERLKNVTVAVLDTGCDVALFNKYYNGKLVGTYDVLNDSTTAMTDINGHGTHVSGTVAEGTPDNVKILPVKISANGKMYLDDIIAGINYVVRDKKADVMNMSFGGYGYNSSLEQVIEAARQQNIITVAAAGNDDTSKNHYPSGLDNTISIASVDSSLNKSVFSNYGSSITFAAPGTGIKSIMGKDTTVARKNGNNSGDDHETINGTSMATPHAASAVAILKSYNKDLNFTDIVELMKLTSIDLGDQGWDQYFGHGLISFKNAKFCDGTNCDKYKVYVDENKVGTRFELKELKVTNYNYYSLTNIMASTFTVYYPDGTSDVKPLWKLEDAEILNYSPTAVGAQVVTIKYCGKTIDINVTNPTNSGYEYRDVTGGIEITNYKNNGLGIGRLYMPDTIDSKKIVAVKDDLKLKDIGNDFETYEEIYLPTGLKRIGSNVFAGTKVKKIYGGSTTDGIEIGEHAFEGSSIIDVKSSLSKVGASAFRDCFELKYINIIGHSAYTSADGSQVSRTDIGAYAFYNCKKLAQINKVKYDIIIVGGIGEYAFYNNVSLAKYGLSTSGNVGEYAFYNTFLLYNFSLYQTNSIGQYAFYGSGISDANLGLLETVSVSAFENCKNLKKMQLTSGRIEERAFWNSGVEQISIGSKVTYIAENAFAYAPVKNDWGVNEGTYKTKSDVGIIEVATNKLVVGFAPDNKLPKIPNTIVEIGEYAYTGNNNLKQIVIPESVTKIGDKAFKDCYQLSDVYILGQNITMNNKVFERENDGDIQNAVITLYTYKNAPIKQYAITNEINYRHIDPDEVVVTNYETNYKAFESIDFRNIGVKLIYHEKTDREEVLELFRTGIYNIPFEDGVGYYTRYPEESRGSFVVSDTYFTVVAFNALGYKTEKKIDVTVTKAVPQYTVPTGLVASSGQKLSEITLPEHFSWMNENEIITGTGEKTFKAKYTPNDVTNYEVVENIDVKIIVSEGKAIITPNIAVKDKIYDGTTNVDNNSVTVSNLNSSDYTVVSVSAISKEIGDTKAKVKLKLNDNKFANSAFEGGVQEKDFEVNLKIISNKFVVTFNNNGGEGSMSNQEFTYNVKQKIKKNTFTKNGTRFIKWNTKSDGTGESYTDEQNVVINKNITLYAIWEEATQFSSSTYVIDETGKYIKKVQPNTDLEKFTRNFTIKGLTLKLVLDGKGIVYTGSKTKLYRGETLYKEYTNVVSGDANGDGIVNSGDLFAIRKHLLASGNLENAYFIAADVNKDNVLNSGDLFNVRKYLLGAGTLD